MSLPGPRRARENRGGATSITTAIRVLSRCPLLFAAAEIFPAPSRVGRPTPPARYWLFYAAVARELASFELADQELKSHWDTVVVPDFAAQGIQLPAKKPGTANEVPGYAAYNRWRQEKVIDARRLHLLRAALMFSAMPLATAIRDAEGGHSQEWLPAPSIPGASFGTRRRISLMVEQIR